MLDIKTFSDSELLGELHRRMGRDEFGPFNLNNVEHDVLGGGPPKATPQDVYDLAKQYIGVAEIPGKPSNPDIEAMHHAVVGTRHTDDISWCAAFVGFILKGCFLQNSGSLLARSYTEYGDEVYMEDAQRGDIVVLWRESIDSWKGHVGFFSSFQGGTVKLLGGNQGDMVNIKAYDKDRILSVRRIPS